ncbi:MAG TPA: DUF6537 domain-containing protein [Elusimicrobiota bacterium]|nr:DUF6537 domain-containing protein [Elusimicrobiota bacterium]
MDERFLKTEGLEIFNGNELILKGALEGEVGLITGYPGSPVSEVFDSAYANRELLKKRGVLAEMANNEALAVARLNGSRMAGVRAIAVMKSVGLHVAADGLALGNLSEPHNAGAGVVVVGDDPWIESTQINNDSRYLSQHLHMPVLEPASFQELKDWVGVAFEMSSVANLYITYLVTTAQADGGGTVWVRPNRYPDVNTKDPVTLRTADFNLDANVLLPPRTWSREATLPARFEALLREARRHELNVLRPPASRPAEGARFPLAFVASGLSYCYLEHALLELGLNGRFPILKLGMTYPIDEEAVLAVAQQADALVVVEEKRGFVESQIVRVLHEARQTGALTRPVDVWGKKLPGGLLGFPVERGINASVVVERLIPLVRQSAVVLSSDDQARLTRESALLEAVSRVEAHAAPRTPTFCPGCPHRDSSAVLLEIQKDFRSDAYMRKTHGSKAVDLVFHGETGCFTMLMFEPNKPLMHNYSGMGLGGGTGAGLDPFVTNKQVVFLGDSTFFHSGMIAISDSIKGNQDITYIILDNKTTAMTGHQPTPGTEMNILGERTPAQDIERVVAGMAGQTTIPVTRVNPGYREAYRQLLEDTILQDGVKVIIADKECGLTYHRQIRADHRLTRRRLGYLPQEKHVNVTADVCEFCLECTRNTGCPGLTIEQTAFGPKVATDRSACVSDGACAKVKACPAFEEITVIRRAAPKGRPALPAWGTIPEPAARLGDPLDGVGEPWYAFTAGVGGMGAGLLTAVLVRAAHAEGFRVLFSDKKGLAVRNGGVYSHLVLSRAGGVLAPIVPYGKADLILGIDLLETVRALDGKQNLRVAQPDRTVAVVNTAQNLTIRMLMGEDQPSAAAWQDLVRSQVRPGDFVGVNFSAVAERYFGSTLYANMILLGVAYQRGYLPMRAGALQDGIKKTVSAAEREINVQAFQAGRWLALFPGDFADPQAPMTAESLIREKMQNLERRCGSRVARAYRWMLEEAFLECPLDDELQRDLALRVYELIHYEDLALARRYLDKVLATARRDRAEWRHQATRAVIHHAFKVIAIKDEVYVSHLLTSPEKRARDRARFDIDPTRGDRIVYQHLTRPEFTLFGRTWRWDMSTRDWQLSIMRRMKFLRRLLPAWHRAEREFRDWYLEWVDRFDVEDETVYPLWVQILDAPAEVRGYREIRYPLMQKARNKVDILWASIRARQRTSPKPLSR